MVWRIILRGNLNKYLLLIAVLSLFSFPGNAEEVSPSIHHLGASKLDAVLSCVRDVYRKPAIWDSNLRVLADPAVSQCPSSESALRDMFAARGIRVFDAGDFVFVVASMLFQPRAGGTEPPHAVLKWSTIKIHLNLQSLNEGDALPEKAPKIAKEILERARMVPFAVAGANNEGFPVPGALDTNLNIAVWTGQLGSGKYESVVAIISGRPLFSTARLVYGELRDGEYVLLWDSPLFTVLHGKVYFADVNGDGNKEIVIESTTYGNQEYPMLLIFDSDGREITRQRKCDTGIAADDNFNEEDGTCAVFGEDITFSENEQGPKDIYVKNWEDSQNHIFKLSNGLYVPGPPVTGEFPPAPAVEKTPSAAEANAQGMKLMQQRDYSGAVTKFMLADLLAGHKNALYANNVGFALYKEEKYDLAVRWFQNAIEIDPQRAVAYLNLGDALAKLNRSKEAREAYSKYLDLAPNSKSAAEVKKKLDALSPPTP